MEIAYRNLEAKQHGNFSDNEWNNSRPALHSASENAINKSRAKHSQPQKQLNMLIRRLTRIDLFLLLASTL